MPFSGCWLWLGCTIKSGAKGTSEYGVIGEGGDATKGAKQLLAHRASWLVHRGTIPEGMQVLHRCDVPCCVNPDHLFLGTRKDNMRDCYRKGRMTQVFKGKQLLADGRNPASRLTVDQVNEIRALLTAGRTATELSEKYPVGAEAIRNIARGKSWAASTKGAL